MQYRNKAVPLERIETGDRNFQITTRSDGDELRRSIDEVGLLSAPYLLENKGSCQIISGFRRIAACRELGWRLIDARVLDPSTSRLECVKIAISDNLHQRPLNVLEKANALHLIRNEAPRSQCSAIARRMGLGGNQAFFDKLVKLKRLPQTIQEAVAREALSLSVAERLDGYDQRTNEMLGKICQELQLGLNKQREIIDTLEEISRRDGVSVHQMLDGEDIRTILDDRRFDRNQKAHLLRRLLKEKRFPRLAAAEEKFRQRVKALKLGENLKLEAPRYFESGVYSLHLYFKNAAQLTSSVGRLRRITEHPVFKQILNDQKP